MSNYEYQVGGSLDSQNASYIERSADRQLYNALQEGKFCYVLNSRQMGKSSLLVRTKHRLESVEFCCAAIDLTGIGNEHINLEQWYKGIISQLYLSFNLIGKVNFKQWWSEQEGFSLVQKLNNFIVDILLTIYCDRRLVIFIDEIDSVFSLPFSTDDFFAFIRFCYNQRAINPQYQRINFAFFGVATPASLMQDKRRTPFNIGQAIQLNSFSLSQSLSLAYGFNLPEELNRIILKDIFRWTSGQPFLTQKLCQIVTVSLKEVDFYDSLVDDLVNSKIIKDWEMQDEPEHLRTISNRILYNSQTSVKVLGICQQILLNKNIPRNDSQEYIDILLSGLVTSDRGYLKVKNFIYKTIFSLEWVENKLHSLRPYSLTLQAWINNNKQADNKLLQGQVLKEALIWAKDKQLDDLDYQYLSASQELATLQVKKSLTRSQIAKKEVEIALESAREANNILAQVKRTLSKKNQNFRLNKQWIGVISLLVTSCSLLLSFTGLFQSTELAIYDRFIQTRPSNPVAEEILVIGINEEDIQYFKEYPISDDTLAGAIAKLQSYKPTAIGLDIYRDLPVEPGSNKLKNILANSNNIWGIEKIIDGKVNPPLTLERLNRTGFNDLVIDADGKVRRALLTYDLDNDLKYSFALQLALKYSEKLNIKPVTNNKNIHRIQLGKSTFKPLKESDGGYAKAKTGGYQILLNYYGIPNCFTTYSLKELLTNKIPNSTISDRIILIGMTADSVNDLFATPYSSQKLMPGVFIHANIISQIIQAATQGNNLFRVLPLFKELIWILLWTFIGTIWVWLFKSPTKLIIAVTITLTSLLIISYQLFMWQWWIPVVPPIVGLLLANISTKMLTDKQRSKIQLKQTVNLLLSIGRDKPAASKIALEYLKQSETAENKIIIDKLIKNSS